MTLGDFGVTLMGFSYMDLMSGLVGTFFYQIVWDSLLATGIALLPFVARVVVALRENYESDDINDAPHQQTNRLIVSLAVMIGVMILAAAPTLQVKELAVRMQLRTCDDVNVHEKIPSYPEILSGSGYVKMEIDNYLKRDDLILIAREKDILNSFRAQITMGEQKVRVPLWWHFWRQMMLGVGTMITAKLPCDNGLRALKHHLNTEFINDPQLAAELGQFIGQCTLKAKASLERDIGGEPIGEEAFLPNYPFYIATYYSRLRSNVPVWGFDRASEEKGYHPTKAKNSSNPSGAPEGYGFPSCDMWWSDVTMTASKPIPGQPTTQVSRGLEERLFKYYGLEDPQFCGKYMEIFGFRVFGEDAPNCNNADGISESAMLTMIFKEQLLGQSEAAMKAQRLIVKHAGSAALLGSHDSTKEGNKFNEAIFGGNFDVGLFTNAWADFSGNLGLLKAMPAATSMLILVVTAMLPLGMIVGRYEIEPLLGLTILYCGFSLWIPYFRMIRWLDDHFVTLVAIESSAPTKIMMEMMIAVAYVAVPLILGAIFTTAGVKVAQLDPVGGDKMGSIANKGAKSVQNLANIGAGKISNTATAAKKTKSESE